MMKLSLFLSIAVVSQMACGPVSDPEEYLSPLLYCSSETPLRNDAYTCVRGLNLNDFESALVSHIEKALHQAVVGNHLHDGVFRQLEGMSSLYGRRFLNGLLHSDTMDFKYLEIGSWKGSTFVSALYGNEGSVSWAMSIDNHSYASLRLGEPVQVTFDRSCEKFLQRYLDEGRLHQLELDSFKLNPLDYIAPGSVNVYFYDGHHSAESQEKAYTHYDSVLSETFITIVDDWLNPKVRNGTYAAFKKLGYTILYEIAVPVSSELRATSEPADWWQGVYCAVIRKS